MDQRVVDPASASSSTSRTFFTRSKSNASWSVLCRLTHSRLKSKSSWNFEGALNFSKHARLHLWHAFSSRLLNEDSLASFSFDLRADSSGFILLRRDPTDGKSWHSSLLPHSSSDKALMSLKADSPSLLLTSCRSESSTSDSVKHSTDSKDISSDGRMPNSTEAHKALTSMNEAWAKEWSVELRLFAIMMTCVWWLLLRIARHNVFDRYCLKNSLVVIRVLFLRGIVWKFHWFLRLICYSEVSQE